MDVRAPGVISRLHSSFHREYTNYCEVQDLYSQRHEIGDNSISRLLPSSWWANATQEGRREEILGMRDILRKWGNVKAEDVKGYRAPYIPSRCKHGV